MRSKLEVASAVAREKLLETHVEQALELITLAEGRVSPPRALEIYARLHRLPPDVAELTRTRALASIGTMEDSGMRTPAVPELELTETSDAETQQQDRAWVLSLLGERFKPRVHLELRRWIELHTGRAEVRVMETHVANGLRFVDILTDDMTYAEAVGVYLEALSIPPGLHDTITFFVLERLAREHLPRPINGARASDSQPLGAMPTPRPSGHRNGGHSYRRPPGMQGTRMTPPRSGTDD
ncbi:MAG: hypothetical protein ACRELV_10775 [Longimicrobiales bacterium]